MPFVVAVPAAALGVLGAALLLFGAGPNVFTGFVLGFGATLLLAASGRGPVRRVVAPPWSHTVLTGSGCAVSILLISLPVLGIRGWAIVLAGGLACAAADRRIGTSRTAWRAHRALLVVTFLAAVEALVPQPIVGLAVLAGAGGGILFPIDLLRRLKAGQSSAHSGIHGYETEALALAAFLDQTDVPRSLVEAAAQEVGAGRASSLRTLAPAALAATGPDSWHIRAMTQEFARQRMLPEERRAWATRAVRMLAEAFPRVDAAMRTRLVPHAVAAIRHAGEFEVDAYLMARLVGLAERHLVAVGQPEEARILRESAKIAALPTNVDEIGNLTIDLSLAERLGVLPEVGFSSIPRAESSRSESSRSESSHSDDQDSLDELTEDLRGTGRRGVVGLLALIQHGDSRRAAGDPAGARRDYRMARRRARWVLPRRHRLKLALRARLNALPPIQRDERNEKRLAIGCFGLIVAVVVLCVGVAILRGIGQDQLKPSGAALTGLDQLVELCHGQRYFPDAAPFAGGEPHPAHVFRRTNSDSGYVRDPFGGNGDPRRTQLVGCAVQTRTGPPVATCKFANQPEIVLHEATYQLSIYETWTGSRLGQQTVTATRGTCPTSYVPPGQAKRWELYAAPTDDQYRQAFQPVLDKLPRVTRSG